MKFEEVEKRIKKSDNYYMPLHFDTIERVKQFQSDRALSLLYALSDWFQGKEPDGDFSDNEADFLISEMIRLKGLRNSHVKRMNASKPRRKGPVLDISGFTEEDYNEPL